MQNLLICGQRWSTLIRNVGRNIFITKFWESCAFFQIGELHRILGIPRILPNWWSVNTLTISDCDHKDELTSYLYTAKFLWTVSVWVPSLIFLGTQCLLIPPKLTVHFNAWKHLVFCFFYWKSIATIYACWYLLS